IMRTASGENYVLDINPRLGGGYPFNHLAGADIPGYYIASLSGHTTPTPWGQYRHGYTAVKHEDVVGFESLAQHTIPNQPHTPELHLRTSLIAPQGSQDGAAVVSSCGCLSLCLSDGFY